MDKVRIGFVGVGGMGQCAHLRNYLTVKDCQVVALAELRPKLAAAVARRYDVPKVYASDREMLANEKLDAIVSIQPFQAYGKLLPRVLESGLPVMIEKPLARSVEAGERILSSLRGPKLYVGYHKRSDPATMWAVKRIAEWKASKEFGAMRYVRVTMPPGDWAACGFASLIATDEPYPQLEMDAPPAGMDDATAKAYESFVNYYIHQVNLIRVLLGENYRATFADPSGVLLAGTSESGVAIALEMAPYSTTIDWQEVALVAFERAWVKIELPAPMVLDRAGRVTVYEDRGGGAEPRSVSPTLPHVHAMRQQAIHFVAAARGGKTPLCEAAEALEDLRIARQYIELKK